jgi:cephalosporin-C deacetylase
MTLIDLPDHELDAYRSNQRDPVDFDAFWQSTLADTRATPVDVTMRPAAPGLTEIEVYDVSFAGYLGQRVHGWLRLPRSVKGRLPVLVEYVGSGGGRGPAEANLQYAASGFAHFQMDNRGQGSGWSPGITPDEGVTGPHVPGFLTLGIDSRNDFYYRRLIVDAVRAIDAVLTLERVDVTKIAVMGISQGGGLALAVAALHPAVAALNARVPFLCDFPRATRIADTAPYVEIVRYLSVHREKRATVMDTLSYFDGVNFARRATPPALFSTALLDDVCPPSTVFGAFNEYAGPKSITVWPYNGHEGGAEEDATRGLDHIRAAFHQHPQRLE